MRARRGRRLAVVAALVVMTCGVLAGQAPAAPRALESYNWSGVAVRGPAMDAVVMQFTVPEVRCTADDEALSIWAGFGGLLEQSLAQAGVQARCQDGNPRLRVFQQFTTGTGSSTEGPEVAPGDVVRVVVCAAPSVEARGRCAAGAAPASPMLASVSVRSGSGPFQVWAESRIPVPWVNTRREAVCIVERPKDATTLGILRSPEYTAPRLQCQPYRSVSPLTRVDVTTGGNGYTPYALSFVPLPGESASRATEPAWEPLPDGPLTATGDPGEPTALPAGAGPPPDEPLTGSPLLVP